MDPARREELLDTALAVRAEEPDAEEPDADGWLRLELTFQDSRHAEWALWQLGTDAEALTPQSLRTSLRNRATAIAARYGDREDPTGTAPDAEQPRPEDRSGLSSCRDQTRS